jgi:hypothetical protein
MVNMTTPFGPDRQQPAIAEQDEQPAVEVAAGCGVDDRPAFLVDLQASGREPMLSDQQVGAGSGCSQSQAGPGQAVVGE